MVSNRRGYHLNQFCMSLLIPANRDRFKADEEAYLSEWNLTETQKSAVRRRDYNAMIAEGGSIYLLGKIGAMDGQVVRSACGDHDRHDPRELHGDDGAWGPGAGRAAYHTPADQPSRKWLVMARISAVRPSHPNKRCRGMLRVVPPIFPKARYPTSSSIVAPSTWAKILKGG
jgi:protocatechuate 4,5-dioxygenase alpha subunit